MIIIMTGSPYLRRPHRQLTDKTDFDSKNPSSWRPNLSHTWSRLLIEPLECVELFAVASETEALGPVPELSDAD